MQEEEISNLKKEITRLQQIIGLLRRQIDVQHQLLSIANIGEALPREDLSNTSFNIGLTQEILSNAKSYEAFPDNSLSNTETFNGQIENNLSNVNICIGQTENGMSNSKNHEGQTTLPKPLPQTLEATPRNISRIHQILKRSGFNKVSHTGIITTIKLLLHFHNKKGGSHKELRKLTGLSAGGLNKFLISLRKRGLIARSGWQQFSLTSAGTAMLQQAGAE